MKIRAYITAYDRAEMLKQVVERFREFDIEPIIYEDGVTHPHRGKKGFWQTWDEILKDCKENEADLYIFVPDDFLELDIEKIKQIHNEIGKPYVYNIVNDGRWQSWGYFRKQQPINGHEIVGYCDCGFFCDRGALEETEWMIKQPNPKRWDRNPNMSSGVGQYLTGKFMHTVTMYKPVKSLAYHGDHESKMHPEERKKNPLKSRH